MTPAVSRTVGAAVLAALAVVPVRAQAPDTLSLDALLAAVEAAPAVRAARLGAEAAEARARGTGFRPDPELDAAVRPGAVFARGGEIAMIRATQVLPYAGTLRRERDAARAMAAAASFEADAEAADRRRAVRLAYYEVYRAQELDAITRRFQVRLGAFAEAAAVRYEVGRGPQGAILQAQLASGRLEEDLRTLAAMRHDALAMLGALVGRPDLVVHGVVHGVPPTLVVLPPPPADTDGGVIAAALARRPELRALDAEADAAEAEADVARLALRPEIGLSVGLVLMGVEPSDLPGMLSVGAMVRLPLNRERIRARQEEAELRRLQVAARREAAEAEVAAELVHHAYAARREAETLDLYRRRLLPQAEATVESLLAAYTAGQANLLDLLDAERMRYELAAGMEEARYRYLAALAELERALGAAPLATASASQP